MPTFEWVFACNTALGSVAPGARDTTFNGKRVTTCRDRIWAAGHGGARPPGSTAGRAPEGFSPAARARSRGSACTSADSSAAERSWSCPPTRSTPPPRSLLAHWQPIARPNRVLRSGRWRWCASRAGTRLAVRIVPISDEPDGALRVFASELDVEWFFEFGHGGDYYDGTSVPDHATLRAGDGTVMADLGGVVYLEDEPIPAQLIEIARQRGDGLSLLGGQNGAIQIPTGSQRPLEPDEWDLER